MTLTGTSSRWRSSTSHKICSLSGSDLRSSTVAELIDYAKKNPDKLTYGSSGNGTSLHLSGELFKQMTATQILHVPYKSVTLAISDLMGGQTDLIFDNLTSVAPHVKSGRLRARSRLPADAPRSCSRTADDCRSGSRGFEVTTWAA